MATKTISIRNMLSKRKSVNCVARKLRFSEVGKEDVYNITAPFRYNKKTYLLGRVEPHSIEESSKTVFFKKNNKTKGFQPDYSLPVFTLQDPSITKIDKMFVLNGVEVKPNIRKKEGLTYRIVFYKGSSLENLKKFAYGPWGMKGIRLVKLTNGKIGVFSRPQGKKGRLGKIGFTQINSLSKLKPRLFHKAKIIPGIFSKGEWGGVNEAHILKNGKIGIIGHIARFSKDKKNKFYYPIVFCLDSESLEISTIRILIRRAELPEGESKRPELYNVVYPGGIIRKNGNVAILYVGVGDAESYVVKIADPFSFYEELE